MADSAVNTTVQVVLEQLLAVATEEFKLVWGFKQDLRNFTNSLQITKQFLEDADKRQITDRAVILWLNNLEGVAYDADEVLDLIKYENLRRKIDIQNQIKPKRCLNMISFCPPLAFRWKMAHKIKQVNANFKRINDQANSLGLEKIFARSPPSLPLVKETDSIAADQVFVGRSNDMEKLVEQITCPTNDVLSVLPIVGMGGIGKTTLARRIFNSPRIKKHFNERIWVCVSEDFDVVKLFKRIWDELKETTSHVDGSRQALVNKIREKLKDKKFLLVLDDLWNKNQNDWSDFKNTLLGVNSNRGNFIIVTTRNQGVASIVSLRDPYSLEKLSDDDCWSIIKAEAFEAGDVPDDHFQTVGKEIVSQCKGSPLAAKMMGGVLRMKEIQEWHSIKEKGPSILEDDENSVMQVLKISFDRLPSSSLKQCFAYCSIFPKDTEISREWLIQLWMAEGFLPDSLEIDMETMGHRFFSILLQSSFLQEPKKDKYGIIRWCKMHDLVHDLACRITKSKICIIAKDRTKYDISQVRHLIVLGRPEALEISKDQMSRVRTLILGQSAPSENLSDFKHLRTLVLPDTYEGFASSIGELIHLRCLDLSNMWIRTLPNSVCKLYNLQTLNSGTNLLEQLPEKLSNLISLRHLYLNAGKDVVMPPQMRRLSCLQTLRFFNISSKEGCRIEELGYLKNLQGKLEIRNLELVKDKAEAEKADLGRKQKIYKLKFCWTVDISTSENVTGSNINDENVLDGLQPHSNLKTLNVEGFRGKNFPLWAMNMSKLANLIKVEFVNCFTCEEVPMLGHLPFLKYLTLERLSNVRSIGRSFYGANNCNSSKDGQQMIVSFPSLESLRVRYLQNLTEWEEVETNKVQVFPCLECLVIESCGKLKTTPSNFPNLKKLDINDVESDLPLINILSSKNLTSLVELSIRNARKLTLLPDDLCYRNQNLAMLDLSFNPRLTHIPHLMACTSSLQSLLIQVCASLRELPNDVYLLESLESLIIDDCENLELILPYNESRGENNSSSCLSSFQYLSIVRCNKLRCLPSEMFNFYTSMQTLAVIHCKNLTSFPKLSGMGCHGSLREVRIGGFSNSMDFTSFQDIFDGVECLKSLEELVLYGRADWVGLPVQLQHITSLKKLQICYFGIEALPDWIENLSSLQRLVLYYCQELRHLPSQEAMAQLTKLKQEYREGRPQFEQRWPIVIRFGTDKQIQRDEQEWIGIEFGT